MAYQVTVYTPAERAAYRADVERNGADPGDLAHYCPVEDKVGIFGRAYQTEAVLNLSFRRPRANLMTRGEWIDALVRAVRECRRKGQTQRGMSDHEVMELLSYSPCSPALEQSVVEAGQASRRKVRELEWSGPGIRVLYGSRDQMRRSLEGWEARGLARALGIEDRIKARDLALLQAAR